MADQNPPAPSAPDVGDVWEANRRRLHGLAYRMLGSLADADDIVQEAFVRYVANQSTVLDPPGWLVTTTTRLCLDQLKSADHTRTTYIGPWLPEPVVGPLGTDGDPEDRITLDETVRMALLVALQELSPAERTALVLHDVFQVPFDELGEIVGRTPDACRQLASRARRRVEASGTGRFDATPTSAGRLAEQSLRPASTATWRRSPRFSTPTPSASSTPEA